MGKKKRPFAVKNVDGPYFGNFTNPWNNIPLEALAIVGASTKVNAYYSYISLLYLEGQMYIAIYAYFTATG